jgi:hypothetical protein
VGAALEPKAQQVADVRAELKLVDVALRGVCGVGRVDERPASSLGVAGPARLPGVGVLFGVDARAKLVGGGREAALEVDGLALPDVELGVELFVDQGAIDSVRVLLECSWEVLVLGDL